LVGRRNCGARIRDRILIVARIEHSLKLAKSNVELWLLAKRVLYRSSLKHHLKVDFNGGKLNLRVMWAIDESPERAWTLLGYLVDSAKSKNVMCDVGAGYLETILEAEAELPSSRLLSFVSQHPRFWNCAQYAWFSPRVAVTVDQVALIVGAASTRDLDR